MMDTDEVEGVKFLEFPKKLGLKMKKEKKKEFRIFNRQTYTKRTNTDGKLLPYGTSFDNTYGSILSENIVENY